MNHTSIIKKIVRLTTTFYNNISSVIVRLTTTFYKKDSQVDYHRDSQVDYPYDTSKRDFRPLIIDENKNRNKIIKSLRNFIIFWFFENFFKIDDFFKI